MPVFPDVGVIVMSEARTGAGDVNNNNRDGTIIVRSKRVCKILERTNSNLFLILTKGVVYIGRWEKSNLEGQNAQDRVASPDIYVLDIANSILIDFEG